MDLPHVLKLGEGPEHGHVKGSFFYLKIPAAKFMVCQVKNLCLRSQEKMSDLYIFN